MNLEYKMALIAAGNSKPAVKLKTEDKPKATKVKAPRNVADMEVSTKKKISKKLKAPKVIEPANVKPSAPKNSPKKTVSPAKKTKDHWDTLTYDEQKKYLEEHPRTKFKLTKEPPKKKYKSTPKKKEKKVKTDKEISDDKPKPVLNLPSIANDNVLGNIVKTDKIKPVKADPSKKSLKSILKQAHLFASLPPLKKEEVSKHIKVWAKHIARATPSKEQMRNASRAVLKAIGSKGRKEVKELRDNIKNGETDEKTVRKASALGALVKSVALLGIGAVGVMAYHSGAENAAAIVAHLVDTYNHRFSDMFTSGGFRSSGDDSIKKFMESLGSATSHNHGGHHRRH